ncbi:29330_t:CDS:1, partial [Racocetra persica]
YEKVVYARIARVLLPMVESVTLQELYKAADRLSATQRRVTRMS